MNVRSSHLLRAAVLVGVTIALCGCESIREAAGTTKEAPNEFAVLTKAPLVIPPDYNLMPPRPGAPPTNQTDPTTSAQVALFGSDPSVIAAANTATASDGETALLAKAGVANADPEIREHLASDRKAMVGSNDDFTNEVLFWKGPKKDNGTAVDADAEAKRLDAQKAGRTGDQPAAPPQEKEKSGWLDGWFDWL